MGNLNLISAQQRCPTVVKKDQFGSVEVYFLGSGRITAYPSYC